MSRVIREREQETHVEYTLLHPRKDCPGAGWGPKCDEEGRVDEDELRARAPACYAEWVRVQKLGYDDAGYHEPYVQKFESTWMRPLLIRCDCGQSLSCSAFTNTCDCGRDYNRSGALLAHRSQWGEETGEALPDILRIE